MIHLLKSLLTVLKHLFKKPVTLEYPEKKRYLSDNFRGKPNVSGCVGCGICKKVCPVSNVEQEEQNKPVFGNNCEGCLSCIHNCPKNAIQMKGQRSEKRFRNPEVSLNEIINSNN